MSMGISRDPLQIRLRWIWMTRLTEGWIVWLCIGGHKPLAHLPAWRRRLHVPAVRHLLWRWGT